MSHGTEARQPLWLGLVASLLLVFGFGGWAARATIASAVIADGQVDADAHRHLIQHPAGGRVAQLSVLEGQQVAAGDLLLRLDADALDGELALIGQVLAETEARELRLRAERDGLADLPASRNLLPVEVIDAQRALFAARRQTLAHLLSQLAQRQLQAEGELLSLSRQSAALGQEAAIVAQDLETQSTLHLRGLIPAARLAVPARDAARLEGALAAIEARRGEVRGLIAETGMQARTLEAQRREEAETQLAQIGAQRIELGARRAALRQQRAGLDLRAPVAGLVLGLAVAPGAVLRPAETALELVPLGVTPLLTLRVRPDDIDHLYPGQPATLLFPALAALHLPPIEGRVRALSPAAFDDPRTGARHYRVDIALTEAGQSALGGHALIPGMAVQAFIATGVRTPLDYMLQPLLSPLARAMREP